MGTVVHEGRKVRDGIKQNVANFLDDCVRLLPLVERVAEACVDTDDIVDVPEYLRQEILTALLGDDIGCLEGLDPDVAEVLHVTHKVAFSVDNLVDRLLALLLGLRNAVDDLLRDRVHPERAGFDKVAEALATDAPFETRLLLEVQA